MGLLEIGLIGGIVYWGVKRCQSEQYLRYRYHLDQQQQQGSSSTQPPNPDDMHSPWAAHRARAWGWHHGGGFRERFNERRNNNNAAAAANAETAPPAPVPASQAAANLDQQSRGWQEVNEKEGAMATGVVFTPDASPAWPSSPRVLARSFFGGGGGQQQQQPIKVYVDVPSANGDGGVEKRAAYLSFAAPE